MAGKLTKEQVAEIRMLGGTMTQQKIADRFGVARSHISGILSGKRYTGRPPHPNPLNGRGRNYLWLVDHVGHDSDDCLIWPFSLNRGYGNLGYKGKGYYAHRLMCELVHGPAPSPDHEASHSCGRGDKGCVHPKHLSWKTRAENERDKLAHGRALWKDTSRKGKRYVLTEAQVIAIRASSKTVTELAEEFHVSRSNIRKILKFETWPTGRYAPMGVPKCEPQQSGRK